MGNNPTSNISAPPAGVADLDARLVAAAKPIKVLANLEWPHSVTDEFLEKWKKGQPKLPEVEYPKVDYSENVKELERVMKACDRSDPLGTYLYATAESYVHAAKMLSHRGTANFTDWSVEMYGKPADKMGKGPHTHLDSAKYFIEYTKSFATAYRVNQEEYCIPAEEVAAEIRKAMAKIVTSHTVEVAVDPSLEAKAAASGNRIRIRGATCFSSRDVGQLIQHEALVHSLTMLNGREQPLLKSLGLGSPRTTKTQEGLAIFAELVTGSIDIARFLRIALRIVGVQLALDGANFIDVFRFFLEATGDVTESCHSSVRVFRGGDPKKGGIFTKDVVYLQGLIYVHTFFRKAMQSDKFEFPRYLFSGRLSLSDVLLLEPYFKSGAIATPLYEPPWLRHKECLAAYLCYSIFANQISLGEIQLADFSAV